MKKFFAALIIVAVFSSVVFYLGWSEFKVVPDTCGVLVTKTHGIDSMPIENGKFYWRWQAAIPKNAKIKTFTIKPYFTTQTVSGSLPSGDVYGSNLGTPSAFDYRFTFNITVFTTPEFIVELFKQSKISNDEDLQNYLKDAASTISQLSSSYILEKCKADNNFRPESIRMSDMFKYISYGDNFPYVEVENFSISSSKIPDFKLYEHCRSSVLNSNYQSYSQNNEVSF